jgi:predicted XRE-type DNA-binding protein
MKRRICGVDAIKASCADTLRAHLDNNNITQAECIFMLMDKEVSLSQPALSRPLRHKFEGFSLDRIFSILMALDIPFVLEI